MVFEVEITNLQGEVLATTRDDRDGTGPGDADPLVFNNYSGLSVEIPLSDSRTASVSFNLANPVVEHLSFDGTADADAVQWKIGALGRLLRVYYRTDDNPQPVFWGPILMQTADFSAGTVTVNAVDPTLRLKHHYVNYSDPQLIGSVPTDPTAQNTHSTPQDYRTVMDLIVAAQNLGSQNAYPDLGIKEDGTNGATATPWSIFTDATGGTFIITVDGHNSPPINYNASAATVKAALLSISGLAVAFSSSNVQVEKPATGTWGLFFSASPAFYDYPVEVDASGLTGATTTTVSRAEQQIQRGANVWDEITQIIQARYGPNIEFEPRDDLGLNANGWPLYCRLNVYDKQGDDLSGSVEFLYDDSGDANLSNVVWEPSGDQVRNQVTITKPNTVDRLFGHDLSAWLDVGIYAAWENPEGGNAGTATDDALQDFAADYVAAQARPPQFVTITPKLHAGQVPPATRYWTAYKVGDEVQVTASKGYLSFSEKCRITKVTLKQNDAANNVQEELEVVPDVTSDSNINSGVDS